MNDDLSKLLTSKVDSDDEPVVVLLTGGHWITGFVMAMTEETVTILPPDGGESWLVRLTEVVAARIAQDHQNGGVDPNAD